MPTDRQQYRAQYEARFRAEHGVSSGTYYQMRRAAASRGISPKTFDAVARREGYKEAKGIAVQARTDLTGARYSAGVMSGAIRSDLAFSDFDDSLDYADIPDDFDWWYH